MFQRLAQQYRAVVHDLVMSLQALAGSLKKRGITATCYAATTDAKATEPRSWPTSATNTWCDF